MCVVSLIVFIYLIPHPKQSESNVQDSEEPLLNVENSSVTSEHRVEELTPLQTFRQALKIPGLIPFALCLGKAVGLQSQFSVT